jgi:hypothetical protein
MQFVFCFFKIYSSGFEFISLSVVDCIIEGVSKENSYNVPGIALLQSCRNENVCGTALVYVYR